MLVRVLGECQISILQGAEYVLQLKEEKASLNKTVNF